MSAAPDLPAPDLPALDLIAEAEAALRRDIAPGGPDARYHALLAANALAMARRELSHPPQDAPADVAAIRAGAHDDDAALHARLLAAARARAWIADPDSIEEPT